jgi:hypothetical protein
MSRKTRQMANGVFSATTPLATSNPPKKVSGFIRSWTGPNDFLRFLTTALLFVFVAAFSGVSTAAPITDILFVRDISGGPKLQSVGFDGTSFTGAATTLETLSPDWSAMSYDAATDIMYFVRDISGGPKLQSVGFDGTSFTGAATTLETLSPDWSAMSYDAVTDIMYFVRDISGGPKLQSVGFDGTSFTGAATTLETLSPDWSAMSIVTMSAHEVPEPGTVPIMACAIALLGFITRYRRAD